jgi:hypothetical protein
MELDGAENRSAIWIPNHFNRRETNPNLTYSLDISRDSILKKDRDFTVGEKKGD